MMDEWNQPAFDEKGKPIMHNPIIQVPIKDKVTGAPFLNDKGEPITEPKIYKLGLNY